MPANNRLPLEVAYSEGRSLFTKVSENNRYLEIKRSHPQNSSGIHRVLVLMWTSMRILVRCEKGKPVVRRVH
jgi:hypothetical protein